MGRPNHRRIEARPSDISVVNGLDVDWGWIANTTMVLRYFLSCAVGSCSEATPNDFQLLKESGREGGSERLTLTGIPDGAYPAIISSVSP